jgi:hypothetical protein
MGRPVYFLSPRSLSDVEACFNLEDYAKDYYKLISSARHKLTAGKRSHRGQVLLGTLVASTVLGKAGGQGQNARGQDLPCFPFRVV